MKKLGKKLKDVRLHLIGHSAGAIVHSHLVRYLGENKVPVASLNLLAAAVRLDVFSGTVLPHLKSGLVQTLRLYQMSSALEEQDETCRAILGYSRSLLYLVSRSFEGGRRVPLLGMKDFLDPALKEWKTLKAEIQTFTSVSKATTSSSHGGFSQDPATRLSVIKAIQKAGRP